jgi:hypothetical protein
MKNVTFLILFFLIGCQNSTKKCCNSNDIVISDIYYIDNNKESSFVCLNGIEGEEIEAMYLSTEQVHRYKIGNIILQINYYHDLISDDLIEQDSTSIISKTLDLSFGKIIVSTYCINQNQNFDSIRLKSIVSKIQYTEYRESKICFDCKEEFSKVPDDFIEIGATKLSDCTSRKELRIQVINSSEENQIDILYDNYELFKKYFKDGDLITFYIQESEIVDLRTYIIVKSKIEDYIDDGFCGMGPKTFGYECIYVNKGHYL